MAMVADRSVRSCLLDHVCDGRTGAFLDDVCSGQGGEHDVQVGFDGVAGAVKHRPGAKIALRHTK
jgi:hypothetical protein